MPVGFVSISVVGFLLRAPPPLGAGMDPGYLYLGVVLALANGAAWWRLYIPAAPPDARAWAAPLAGGGGGAAAVGAFGQFRASLLSRDKRAAWLPLIKWNCLALMIDMYAVRPPGGARPAAGAGGAAVGPVVWWHNRR